MARAGDRIGRFLVTAACRLGCIHAAAVPGDRRKVERSARDLAEVTTKLGDQTLHAVEILIRRIDKLDRDRGGKLLADRSLSRLLRDDWPKTIEELEEG